MSPKALRNQPCLPGLGPPWSHPLLSGLFPFPEASPALLSLDARSQGLCRCSFLCWVGFSPRYLVFSSCRSLLRTNKNKQTNKTNQRPPPQVLPFCLLCFVSLAFISASYVRIYFVYSLSPLARMYAPQRQEFLHVLFPPEPPCLNRPWHCLSHHVTQVLLAE